MHTTQHLLLARGWDREVSAPDGAHETSSTPGWRALAAALGYDADVFRDLLRAAFAGGDREAAPVVRLVVPSDAGARIVLATELPVARSAPGAPSTLERYREAGLRLGAESSTGTMWCDAPESSAEFAPEEIRDSLWLGARLGGQQPAAALAREAIVFADGALPSAKARTQAEAVGWVRQLVARPANLLGPEEFAREISDFASAHGPDIEIEVWRADELADRGFGALLAVGGGSARAPLAVRMRWGSDDVEHGRRLGLVGKGVTFDSGGVNIKKDPAELAWMKSDMAAAASIAAALVIASQLGVPGAGVEAILPICDNAVSGGSVRPGDVVTHPDGRTTEVVDTDCEGRLVLADGLIWLRDHGAGVLFDSGTLTDGGAGLRRTGLWSNDSSLSKALVEIGEGAGDPLWSLPLAYGEEAVTRSRVADLRNAPMDRPDVGRHAATYLAEIVGDTPWAHFDTGGTAYLEADFAGWPEGPTGASTVAISEAILAWSRDALH